MPKLDTRTVVERKVVNGVTLETREILVKDAGRSCKTTYTVPSTPRDFARYVSQATDEQLEQVHRYFLVGIDLITRNSRRKEEWRKPKAPKAPKAPKEPKAPKAPKPKVTKTPAVEPPAAA